MQIYEGSNGPTFEGPCSLLPQLSHSHESVAVAFMAF